jgi:hypothetical protein
VACNPSEAKVNGEFNKNIKPQEPAAAEWSNHASEVHGTCPNDARIASAVGITEVWKQFVLFIEGHLADGTKKNHCCLQWPILQSQVAVLQSSAMVR